MSKDRLYVCDMCGHRFVSDWTEAEAEAEYSRRFPEETEKGVVCDACYKFFLHVNNLYLA